MAISSREPCCCPPDGQHLTHREIEVLVLVAAGMISKRIGRTLGISARTVNLHSGGAPPLSNQAIFAGNLSTKVSQLS